MSWIFRPDYRFYLQKLNPTSGEVDTFSISTLQSCNASLMTGSGVNEMAVVFADPGKAIQLELRPHVMNVVQMWLQNRFGEWAVAWTGVVREVHFTWDDTNGDQVQLKCDSPYCYWEITTEEYSEALSMSYSFMYNITGANVLRYSARAVNFPDNMLVIDPLADAGTGISTSVGSMDWTNADQQTWSSVIQGFLGDSGLEMFFDERGRCHYRTVSFLRNEDGSDPRWVDDDEVINYDLIEMDAGVITDLEVRYGPQPVHAMAGQWTAPDSMRLHLRKRLHVTYAPWIQASNDNQAASFLANVLGPQAAAGLLRAVYTVPADPMLRIGNIISVPSFRNKGGSDPNGSRILYYVSSITYQLQWGAQWVMTLGLTYGRANNASFPYLQGQNVAYPILTADDIAAMPQGNTPIFIIPPDLNNPSRYAPLSIVPQTAKISTGQVQADPGLFAAGTVIQLKDMNGNPINGPSHNGEYTVVSGGPGGSILGLSNIIASNVVAIVVKVAPSLAPTTSTTMQALMTSTGTSPYKGTAFDTGPNVQPDTNPTLIARPPGQSALAMKALGYGYSKNMQRYILRHAGNDGWDCSGLVAWAFYQCGINAGFTLNGGGSYNTDVGPQGLYDFFKRNGATPIAVDQAVPGDLYFILPGPHACWCWKSGGIPSGQSFGANNDQRGPGGLNGIYIADLNGFRGDDGNLINFALGMSTFKAP